MRCHYVTDEETGLKVLIPGCWGSVDRDDTVMCTCYKPIQKGLKKKSELTKDDLESECRMLREINERLNEKNRKLHDRILELERQGLPLDIRRSIDSLDNIGHARLWSIFNRIINSKKH